MTDRHPDEMAVHEIIMTWTQATIAADVDAVMALYTDDVTAFDAIGALQHKGAEAYRRHWEVCMAEMPSGGQMIMEPHEVKVSLGGDLAIAHYLAHCGFAADNGDKHLGWMRGTVCCRKTPNGWRIVHEHYSSPFDPHTMKVTEGLKP